VRRVLLQLLIENAEGLGFVVLLTLMLILVVNN
jgi:hypothetical protein